MGKDNVNHAILDPETNAVNSYKIQPASKVKPSTSTITQNASPKLSYISLSAVNANYNTSGNQKRNSPYVWTTKDAKSTSKNIIPTSKHFHDSNHEFNRDAVFIIIEQIKNSQKTKHEKRIFLMKRKNLWINKLQTMTPNGLKRDLNNV